MADKSSHPVRTGITITVVGGIILAGILAAMRASVPAAWDVAKKGAVWVCRDVSVPGWLIWPMALLSGAWIIGTVRHLWPRTPPWSEYAEDTFDGVVWRWSYNGSEPAEFTAFCPHCDMELDFRQDWEITNLWCDRCHKEVSRYTHEPRDLRQTAQWQAARKIRSGEWRQVVAAQRAAADNNEEQD